jgi:ADP-ribose pyrophosphatase
MKLKNFEERVLESKKIFDGRILKLRVDTVATPNGKIAVREVIDHFVTAVIIPVTDDNEIIFTRQYRLPVGKVLLELPAGRIEDNEDPQAGGQRELLEETGYTAAEWLKKLACYSSPGYSNELMHFFVARGLKKSGPKPDEDELIEIVRMPLKEAFKKLEKQEFEDAKTIIGLLVLKNDYRPA